MCVNIYIYCSKIAVESWGSKHSGADFLRFRVPQDNTCHEPLSNLGHSILPKIAWHCEWGRSIKVLENVSLLAFLTCRSTSCESFECSLPCLTATPPACPLPTFLLGPLSPLAQQSCHLPWPPTAQWAGSWQWQGERADPGDGEIGFRRAFRLEGGGLLILQGACFSALQRMAGRTWGQAYGKGRLKHCWDLREPGSFQQKQLSQLVCQRFVHWWRAWWQRQGWLEVTTFSVVSANVTTLVLPGTPPNPPTPALSDFMFLPGMVWPTWPQTQVLLHMVPRSYSSCAPESHVSSGFWENMSPSGSGQPL